MDAQLEINLIPEVLVPVREEDFPMQEQALYPLPFQDVKPAADILADHLAEGDSGTTSPFFLPKTFVSLPDRKGAAYE
jgi:hypothetical protein